MAIYKVLMEKGTKIITDSLNAVKSQVSVLTASVSRNTSDIAALRKYIQDVEAKIPVLGEIDLGEVQYSISGTMNDNYPDYYDSHNLVITFENAIPATIEGASIYNTTYIEGNKVIGGTAGEYHDTLTIKDADGNVLLTHLKVASSVPHHGGSVN